MYVMPARWGFQGSIAYERAALQNDPAWNIDLHKPDLTSPPDFITGGHFQCSVAQMASDSIAGAWGFTQWDMFWLPWAVLYGMTVLMLVTLLIALKRRDPV
jgi:ABC transport system ATP-binding/permease protein